MDPFQIETILQRMTRDLYSEGGQLHMSAVASARVSEQCSACKPEIGVFDNAMTQCQDRRSSMAFIVRDSESRVDRDRKRHYA